MPNATRMAKRTSGVAASIGTSKMAGVSRDLRYSVENCAKVFRSVMAVQSRRRFDESRHIILEGIKPIQRVCQIVRILNFETDLPNAIHCGWRACLGVPSRIS